MGRHVNRHFPAPASGAATRSAGQSETAIYDADVAALSQPELEAAHCWEPNDSVPRRPDLTDFRRRLRYHQAQWREAKGHPIGTQPIAPRPGDRAVRLVGSRLPLPYALETGATFLTASALDAAQARTLAKEPQQMWDAQRLWADLLWSTALCFNLFGDLAADLALANRAVHTWWPDAPGTVCDVRFEHSPGRLDMAYLGNLCQFSVAFVLDLGDGTKGIVGLKTMYHELNRPQAPKPTRLWRYREVTERSGIFEPGAFEAVNGTDLIHIWLDHMLVHSMLQHPSGTWKWGRFVLIHPAGNTAFAEVGARYRDLLVDPSTVASMTIEELLDADVLPARTAALLRERYIID
jgi:hypothetical protein